MTNERNGRMRHGWALIPLGVALVTISVLADAIGLGGGDYVFGWEQKLGVLVGTSMAWITTVRMLRPTLFASTRSRKTVYEAPPVVPVSSASA